MLGHTAHIIISCPSILASVDAWESIGFTVLAIDDAESPSWARLTDGQIVLFLTSEHVASPALGYFHQETSQLRQRLHDRGATVTSVSDTELLVEGPGGIPIHVHRSTDRTLDKPTKEASPLFGYCMGIGVGVQDAAAAKTVAERMGFLVAEQTHEPFVGYDMTDGCTSLLLQQTTMSARPILYATEIDEELVADLAAIDGIESTAVRSSDGQVFMIKIRMPEGTTLLVNADD